MCRQCRGIARDAYMTSPALLIALVSQVLQSIRYQGGLDAVDILLRFGLWFAAVLFLFLAARLLRGTADFTSTLRVAGFAQSAHILELLGFIPVVGPLARFMALILAIVGLWIGVAAAHELKGWRTIALPVIYVATLAISFVFLAAVIGGAAFTIDGLMQNFGLLPGP